jgi:hypothetical protein
MLGWREIESGELRDREIKFLGSAFTSKITHLRQESNNVCVCIFAENEFGKYVPVGI